MLYTSKENTDAADAKLSPCHSCLPEIVIWVNRVNRQGLSKQEQDVFLSFAFQINMRFT